RPRAGVDRVDRACRRRRGVRDLGRATAGSPPLGGARVSIRRALLASATAVLAFPAAAAGATPSVTTSLTPRSILFGDTVHARVDVIVDTHRDDPSTIALRTPLGSWTVLTPVALTTSGTGTLVRRTFVLTLACR